MATNDSPSQFRLHHIRLFKEMRLAAQLSQTQLVERLSRHRSWVSRVETGDENISIESVAIIRLALIAGEADKAPLNHRIAGNVASTRTKMEPKLSQEALSAKAGCDLKFVGRLETATSGATLDSLGKVVDVLGMHYDLVFSTPLNVAPSLHGRMKAITDIGAARNKVLSDALACVQRVRDIAAPQFSTADEGIRILRALRTEVYEDLNQIQHEHMILCALEWIAANYGESRGIQWSWNPRQTGTSSEPDLRGVENGETVLSAEITTSANPVGTIATRMHSTLAKLARMPGEKLYFVSTPKMQKLANTKITEAQLDIKVVLLED